MKGSRNIPDETSARRCIPEVSLKFPLASTYEVPDETSANYGIYILSRTIGGKLGQPHFEFHGNKSSRDNYSRADLDINMHSILSQVPVFASLQKK
jgi:hypothetical protein